MAEQPLQMPPPEPRISTDDLCLIIGEKEVKLYRARQQQQAVVEQAKAAVQANRHRDAEAQKKALAEEVAKRTEAIARDREKMSANVQRLQARVQELQAAVEAEKTMRRSADEDIDMMSRKCDALEKRAEEAEKELARRDKISRSLKRRNAKKQ